jgi:hypothetical protein
VRYAQIQLNGVVKQSSCIKAKDEL